MQVVSFGQTKFIGLPLDSINVSGMIKLPDNDYMEDKGICNMVYCFDENNICDMVMIFPTSMPSLEIFVGLLNDNYLRTDTYTWYSYERSLRIKIYYSEDAKGFGSYGVFGIIQDE